MQTAWGEIPPGGGGGWRRWSPRGGCSGSGWKPGPELFERNVFKIFGKWAKVLVFFTCISMSSLRCRAEAMGQERRCKKWGIKWMGWGAFVPVQSVGKCTHGRQKTTGDAPPPPNTNFPINLTSVVQKNFLFFFCYFRSRSCLGETSELRKSS